MIGSLTWFSFVSGLKTKGNLIAATAFVVPLGLFFPIQSTADFFGQWNNIFMCGCSCSRPIGRKSNGRRGLDLMGFSDVDLMRKGRLQ